MRTLVVSPHPDDEVLGAGGYIKRITNKGHNVDILWLGSGRPARTFGQQTEQEKARHEVLGILGAQEVVVEASRLEDNQFDSVPLLNIIQRVEAVLDSNKYETVLTTSETDLNIDHQIVAKAVRTAVVRRPEIKELYAFEILSSTEWSNEAFNPNVFVDIADTLVAKIEAIKCYNEELRQWPHPRSTIGIETLARYRGMQAGLEYAEAFQALRTIR